MTEILRISDNEYWWGMAVSKGIYMPFSKDTDITIDLNGKGVNNQMVPLLVSSKGRYIWSENPLSVTFKDGEIILSGEEIVIDDIKLPVKFGDVVGKIIVYSGNKKVKTGELTVSEDINNLSFLKLLLNEFVDLVSGEF